MKRARLLGALCAASAAVSLPSAASAGVSFSARYSPAANVFQILDCVARPPDDSCGDRGAYRRVWKRRAGWSAADDELFGRYYRLKLGYEVTRPYDSDPRRNPDGLFASLDEPPQDPIAAAFYRSQDFSSAMRTVSRRVSPDDFRFLGSFYAHYRAALAPFLRESRAFAPAAAGLNKQLADPRYAAFFHEVERFYGLDADIRYVALYVWWPPLKDDYAFAQDDRLILSQNPLTQLGWPEEDIVFHEVVHTISERQPRGRKEALTRAFLSECDPRDVALDNVLEEPLAVAIGQMLFLKRFEPGRFATEADWYQNPWVDRMGPALFPKVQRYFADGRSLDAPFMLQAGKTCRRLAARARRSR